MEKPPVIDATDDVAVCLGLGWEVAPVTSLVSGWGHSLQIGTAHSSAMGASCEEVQI